jgi:citronellol/citronellal dehydrogenase
VTEEQAASSSLAPDANLGRVALISGGGTGIGRATALAFATSGANVAICGRHIDSLASTAEQIESLGGTCLPVVADVREHEEVSQLVDTVLDRFGAVDVLVNNAGGQFTAPAEEITLKGWRAVHRLAVDAAWDMTQTVASRSMIPRRTGLIVFIGFSPRRGIPGMVHASAARAAVEILSSALAAEWGGYGIRSVCVAPGNIATSGLEGYGAERVAEWTAEVPLQRLGTAEEVGEVIAFLSTASGGYISGTTIVIDGGLDAWQRPSPRPGASP